MELLRKYIGLYLTVLLLPFMFGYGVSEDHPIWVWWIAFGLVILKTPPYNISDRFWDAYTRLIDWILIPKKSVPKGHGLRALVAWIIILFRRSITIINRLYYITLEMDFC